MEVYCLCRGLARLSYLGSGCTTNRQEIQCVGEDLYQARIHGPCSHKSSRCNFEVVKQDASRRSGLLLLNEVGHLSA